MHSNSKLLFEKYALPELKPGMSVLEIGPDGFPSTYQLLAEKLSLQWHTLDMYDHPSLTYPNSKEYCFAVPDDSYDVVLSGQVIEHVKKIWRWLPELARVTKPGGLVITINPVSWGFHEYPVDCWRIYPDGMKALYEDAALKVSLSHWESLEMPGFSAYQPGVSWAQQGRKKKMLSIVFGRLGFPVERSYDTVTIGRKGGLDELG
jgi:SAM-dependent methyltransferase